MKSSKALNLYPIDYPFETLINRINTGKLILDPYFQRQYKWDKDGYERSSKFIESCLMRIPLPACYFAEDELKNHLVIDGVQRITTILKFFNNEFPLEGLKTYKELNGKYFRELGDYISDLETYTIRCIILRNDNEKDLIQDIFTRLNQGSVLLSAQEIRHAVNPGNLDDLLKELSAIPIIKEFNQSREKNHPKFGLEQEELVLRFFALRGNLNDYEDNIAKYLDKYMDDNQEISNDEKKKLRSIFVHALNNCIAVFDKRAFVNARSNQMVQSKINYDLLMWAFQDYDTDFVLKNKENLKEAFSNLCNNLSFKKASTGKILKRSAIIRRRMLWKEELSKVHLI